MMSMHICPQNVTILMDKFGPTAWFSDWFIDFNNMCFNVPCYSQKMYTSSIIDFDMLTCQWNFHPFLLLCQEALCLSFCNVFVLLALNNKMRNDRLYNIITKLILATGNSSTTTAKITLRVSSSTILMRTVHLILDANMKHES